MTENHKRTWTVPEMLDLADRMIGYGTKESLGPQVRQDCHSCGMILANLLLKSVIAEAVILAGGEDSPPTAPT
jgi:hypothetical protein